MVNQGNPRAEKLKLTAEIKARIRQEHRDALQRIAFSRDMDVSDLIRQYIRHGLEREEEPVEA